MYDYHDRREEHMENTIMGPEIAKSALLIVNMQNDFVHPEGGFAHIARKAPEARVDMPFLMGTIPHVKRLTEAYILSTPRNLGRTPRLSSLAFQRFAPD